MEIIEQSHTILTNIDRYAVLAEIEQAGRTAYKSEDRITAGSASIFVSGIIKRGHESVIEHCNLSVRFITDRGVTHELVRHRLCAFTQESTRYCNYSKKGMQVIKPVFWDEIKPEYWDWMRAMIEAEKFYTNLISKGATPQEARTVLPNSLKTEIVVTANLREWRHILRLRADLTAHPQMRALMLPLLNELKNKLPEIFEDIEEVG
jgi:thymidylate synthase (FAD)